MRDGEKRYELLIENLPQKIFLKDRDSVYVSCNRNYARDLGIEPSEIVGKTDYAFFPEKMAEKYVADDQRIMKLGNAEDFEEEYVGKDGHDLIVNTIKTPIKDKNGNSVGILGIFWDITQRKRTEEELERYRNELETMVKARTDELKRAITQLQEEIQERKRAEQALRDSEEKYRLLVSNANDAIFIAQDGIIKFPNLKTQELTGHTLRELADTPFIHLVHPQDRDMVLERYERWLVRDTVPTTCSFRILHSEGKALWVQMNSALITWEGKPAVLNFVRDITQQRRVEARLRQRQKMEAIGTLAGGIAHDFNNLLLPIIAHAEIALSLLPEGSPVRYHLDGVIKGGLRARDLTGQILTFSRQKDKEVVPLEIHVVVKEALKFLRSSLPTSIEVREKLTVSGSVMADPTQIQQLVMNLCINAYHAMRQEGGILEVSVSGMRFDTQSTSRSQYPDLTPGPYVRLTVSDTGHGMDQAVMKRIFEPYFTTKEKGGGTGLGLAVVHGIVKSHGGAIRVYSEPGKGTTFHVYLPMVEGAKKVPETEAERPFSAADGYIPSISGKGCR